MAIAETIRYHMKRASWIRRMFEEGAALKARYGPKNVFDFTLGNPDVPPPALVDETLIAILKEEIPLKHGYMPNAGFAQARLSVAEGLTSQQQIPVGAVEHLDSRHNV